MLIANGAIKQNRTADLFLTKEVLYQLSYNGLVCLKKEAVLYYIWASTASGKMKEKTPSYLQSVFSI